MKKLLIILGAVSLTATPSLVVVSCSSKTTVEYNQFIELADATRPTFDENGNVVKKGSTLIYYMGGSNNYSSLSFEHALKKATKKDNINEAFIELNNSTTLTGSAAGQEFKKLGASYTLGSDAGIKDVKVEYNKKKSRWEYVSKSNNDIFSTEVNKNTMGDDINIAGFQTSKASELWTNKTSKKILSDWITPSIARMTYEISLDIDNETINESTLKVNKNKIFEEAKTKINAESSKISEARGPIFLIIRNGELIGYLNGYTLYNEANNVVLEKDLNAFINKGRSYKENDLKNFFTLWKATIPFQDLGLNNTGLLNNVYKEAESNFSYNESDKNNAYKSFIEKWDNGDTNRIED